MNPYRSTPHAALAPDTAFRWKRIAAYVLSLYLIVNGIGFISGFTMMNWQIYGDTIEEAVDHARLARRIAIWIAAMALYWRLAAGVNTKRAQHILAAFVGFWIFNAVVDFFVFRASAGELIDPWALLRSAAAALAGLGLAHATVERSA